MAYFLKKITLDFSDDNMSAEIIQHNRLPKHIF